MSGVLCYSDLNSFRLRSFTEALTIPVNKNSLEMFPTKLTAILSSWQPATFEEFMVRTFFPKANVTS